MIDIDALSRPISDDKPSGPDLEYAEVAELERFSAGTPGVLDPATRQVVGAEEPNWRKVAEKAAQVLGKTKDLRAAAWLTRAELANRGLPGLADGLKLIAALSDTFWESIYPPLDRDEGNDPIERLNVLANLSPDPASSTAEAMLRALRATVICESREVGRYTVRDLEYVLGRMTPPDGQKAPVAAMLAGAWKSGDPAANQERRDGIANGMAAIQAIIKLFNDRSGQRPNLDLLQHTLKRVGDFYVEHDPVIVEEPEAVEDEDDGGPAVAGGARAARPRSSGLATRADAVRMLQEVAAYLRKAEPSSPAPMFVDRAVKVLQMDFNTLIRELMPESKDRIQMLGGISLDPEKP